MIATEFILKLTKSFPNAEITQPINLASYVFDANREIIGWFNYRDEIFRVNQDYKYVKEASKALSEQEVEFEWVELSREELAYGQPPQKPENG